MIYTDSLEELTILQKDGLSEMLIRQSKMLKRKSRNKKVQ